MRLFDALTLAEEKGQNLLLLDIDDTLVIPKNIFIYKKEKVGSETKLSPNEYAKQPVEPGAKYDFREFRDPQKLYNSIQTGLPIVSNLKIVDDYIKNGWKIGILTARAMEEVVYQSLKDWLKYKDSSGDLQKVGDKLVRSLVHAINDENKKYPGETSFEKKANVIKQLAGNFDRIVFVDDDIKNINAVKELGLKNVFPKLAHKMEKHNEN